MRWQSGRRSDNIEDRRGARGPAKAAGGLGGIGLVVIVVMMLMGKDPREVLGLLESVSGPSAQVSGGTTLQVSPEEQQLADFVRVVLADTEDVWTQLFAAGSTRYQPPTLVLFRDQVESACGHAHASMGPFYCPVDRKAYIDLSFYDDLRQRHQAPGDFAQAYVIAHEIGHHIQNLLGISDKVHAKRATVSEKQYNQLSVRLELQADYLAGVWAHHANKMRNILETGDVEEALNAASAIGDDRLQRESRGTVVPDSFTHGTSAQRVRWFRKGLQTGDLKGMNELFSQDYDRL